MKDTESFWVYFPFISWSYASNHYHPMPLLALKNSYFLDESRFIFCSLLVIFCLLLLSFFGHCLLLSARCLLLFARCSLRFARCWLLSAHCSLVVAHSLLIDKDLVTSISRRSKVFKNSQNIKKLKTKTCEKITKCLNQI